MKASMFVKYPARSLVRGGQRTLLAIFCIAVGVMAIVALQSVGLMITESFNPNVRDLNGGDITLSSNTSPILAQDLSFFTQLKQNKTISDFTPLIQGNSATLKTSQDVKASQRQSFPMLAVDPKNYPLVAPPVFNQPNNGSFSSLLTTGKAVVTQSFADLFKKGVGDTIEVIVGTGETGGRTVNATISGIVQTTGPLAQFTNGVIISIDDYQAADTKIPLSYNAVSVVTPSPDKDAVASVKKTIQDQFPQARITTTEDAIQQQQQQIDLIQKFLVLAGLLALLVGGVGIVNTMQVMLSRRKTEIAMLKTTGYRRFDLYMLFGTEAGLLGLIGGLVGTAAGIGISGLVRAVVEQNFGLHMPFAIHPEVVIGGLVIGLVTSLIFGLMPIVQAANIRPLNVIRELPESNRTLNILISIGLLFILSVLFCLLSIFILKNDVILGIGFTYGTFILLAILSGVFAFVGWLVSILPVPEKMTWRFGLLVLVGILISLGLTLLLPSFGILLLVVSLLGPVVVFLPRTWKANIKMALRNIGRQRARTTTTMLALFVGIFTIGLVVILTQNLSDQLSTITANSLSFNMLVQSRGADETQKVSQTLQSQDGVIKYQQHEVTSSIALKINQTPIAEYESQPSIQQSRFGKGLLSSLFSNIEGYNIAQGQFPEGIEITSGRGFSSSDADQNTIMINAFLSNAPYNLKPGDTITLTDQYHTKTITATIVGFFTSKQLNSFASVFATNHLVEELSPPGAEQTATYVKAKPEKSNSIWDALGDSAPNARVLNLANIGDVLERVLNQIMLTLVALASLSLLAGVIIIANAVALAMLERRRELGILKSVGYTSRSILGTVLIENGVIGGLGAFGAILLVMLIVSILGKLVFQSDFAVHDLIGVGLIVGSVLLSILIAVLVAWGAVRVRPLEVLRYE